MCRFLMTATIPRPHGLAVLAPAADITKSACFHEYAHRASTAMLRLTGRGVIDALGAIAERVVAHLNALDDADQ